MKKAIIIDDEKHCISNLEYELQKWCPEIELVASLSDPRKGKKLLNEIETDVVFLDIEMPWMTGFELLESMEHYQFSVIFVTAYDQYAIQAFKYSAIDYLLKPVNGEELCQAVCRLQVQKNHLTKSHFDVLVQNLKNDNNRDQKIVLPTSEGLEFVLVDEILHCSSDGNYCNIKLLNGNKIYLAKTLKEIESLLADFSFIRIHNSHLIAEKHIKKYVHADGGMIEMIEGTLVPISRLRKSAFLERFK